MVWSHSPVVEEVGVICIACEPLCTGLLTTISPALHIQPESVPLSKPPLATRFPPVDVGVGVGVLVLVAVGVAVGVLVAVGVGVGVPPLLPLVKDFQAL